MSGYVRECDRDAEEADRIADLERALKAALLTAARAKLNTSALERELAEARAQSLREAEHAIKAEDELQRSKSQGWHELRAELRAAEARESKSFSPHSARLHVLLLRAVDAVLSKPAAEADAPHEYETVLEMRTQAAQCIEHNERGMGADLLQWANEVESLTNELAERKHSYEFSYNELHDAHESLRAQLAAAETRRDEAIDQAWDYKRQLAAAAPLFKACHEHNQDQTISVTLKVRAVNWARSPDGQAWLAARGTR